MAFGWRKLLARLGLAAAFAALAGPVLAEPSVSAVRLGEHPDKTRFVMEIDEAPAYRIFSLADPYRVVIDLPKVDWRIPDTAKARSRGVVERLRFGLFAPDTSRVVLDAAAPVRVRSAFVIPPRGGHPYRLVVDLARVSQQTFAREVRDRIITSDKALPAPDRREAEVAAPSQAEAGKPTVVLDAGHGGVDPGAIGVTGVHEKVIALDYARALKRALENTGRYRVILTRDRDIFLRLRQRVALAQEASGDLFISLHANTHPSNNIRGASVYTLSETSSDAEAAALAEKENKADVIAGVDLNGQSATVSQILIDLAQRETMNTSKYFANLLVNELDSNRVKLLRNTHRFAGFAVLKSPNVPSVLFEIGYMSHPKEVRLLRSAAHRRKVNSAVVGAVNRFFEWQEARNRL